MFSGVVDPSPMVTAGSTPLQPTTKAEFRAHHGKKSTAQKLLGNLGRRMDQANGQGMPKVIPRYQPHNCLPWRSDNCVSHSQPVHVPNHLAPTVWPPATQRQPFNPGPSSPRHLSPTLHPTQQRQPFIPSAFPPGDIVLNPNYRAEQRQSVNPGPSFLRGLGPTKPPTLHGELFLPSPFPTGNMHPT